jgi:hypothetical protein
VSLLTGGRRSYILEHDMMIVIKLDVER